jgi:hypothetical protein
MLHILEHGSDPIGALNKAASFLRSTGILIVNVPNALAINSSIARAMGTLIDEYELSPYDIEVAGHRRSYDRKLLVSDIEAARLNIVSTDGVFLKMLSTAQLD